MSASKGDLFFSCPSGEFRTGPYLPAIVTRTKKGRVTAIRYKDGKKESCSDHESDAFTGPTVSQSDLDSPVETILASLPDSLSTLDDVKAAILPHLLKECRKCDAKWRPATSEEASRAWCRECRESRG